MPLWVFSVTVQERIDEVVREMSAARNESEEDEEAWNQVQPWNVSNASLLLSAFHSFIARIFSDIPWAVDIEIHPVELLNDWDHHYNIIYD